MTGVGRAAPSTSGAEFVILNQYYVPDVASTGHLLAELAHESAAMGRKVSVVSSFPSYGPPETWQPCEAKEVCDGVSIWRMKTTRFRKDSLLGRASNSVTFLVPLGIHMCDQAFNQVKDIMNAYKKKPCEQLRYFVKHLFQHYVAA